MKFNLNLPKSLKPASVNTRENSQNPLFVLLSSLVFVLILAYLLYIPVQKALEDPGLKVGDTVKQDVIIQKDITIQDKKNTEQNIKEARKNILPIYEYNTEIQEKSQELLYRWFDLIRESRKKYIRDRNELPNIARTIGSEFGIEIETGRLDRILRTNIFGKIDVNGFLNFLAALERQKIVASKVGTPRSKDGTLKLAVSTGEPIILTIADLIDLKEVETAVKNYLKEKKFSGNEIDALSPILMEFADVNLSFSANLTREEEKRVASQINPSMIKLSPGKTILRKGDEVQAEDLRIIQLIIGQEKGRGRRLVNFYLIAVVLAMLTFFFRKLSRVWRSTSINKEKLFIVIGSTLVVSAAIYRISLFLLPLIIRNISLGVHYDIKRIFYVLPFGFGALIIAFLFTLPDAVIFSFLNALMGSILCNWNLRIFLYILLACLAISFGMEYYSRAKRSSIIKASILWLVPVNITVILILNLTEPGGRLTSVLINLLMGVFSAFAVPVLASFMIPFWELLFKMTTELKLVELTSLNLPIFREMLEKAPGTYHHSQMVASLAEAAATNLGLSPLRLTAMALYHDIGKIDNPHLFTENHSIYQNPHTTLNPRESAKSIISHIPDGLERADRLKLPQIVKSAIPQHHGTKLVHFFYEKAREMSSIDTDEIDDTAFRYQGEKPQSIETAIIMLADQVEAASKSLGSPSEEEIQNVIEKIIDANIEENQFDECEDLTFKALNIIAYSFHQKLSSIYHMRVSYPGFDFKEKKENHKK